MPLSSSSCDPNKISRLPTELVWAGEAKTINYPRGKISDQAFIEEFQTRLFWRHLAKGLEAEGNRWSPDVNKQHKVLD